MGRIDNFPPPAGTVPADAWTPYTPTVKLGATVVSIQNASTWTRIGRTIFVSLAFRLTNLNGGTGNLTATLPVASTTITDPANPYVQPFGLGQLMDISAVAVYVFAVSRNNVGDVVCRNMASPTAPLTNAVPVTLVAGANGTGDEFYAMLTYEAAS